MKEIAQMFHCNRRHVRQAIKDFGFFQTKRGNAGKNNPAWKGGIVSHKSRYVKVYAPHHPHHDNHNYVWQHRMVMEQKLGRLLEPKEVVHHIDGNGLNNHPDNLQLFASNADHLRHELKGRVPNWTPQGKANILASVAGDKQRERRRAKASTSAASPPAS